MTEPDPPPLKRLKLNRKELEELTKEEIVERWLEQDQYVDVLEARNSEGQRDSLELVGLRESEDKLRQQQLEATRRENLLVMRLAAKEQEMQECASQIQDLKQAQTPGSAQLRSTLLDPAVNLMFESMKKELNSTKAKLEETQNELSAWKFTPDSNTGKRLMAKCRLLYQENEELGKMISTGRIAKLEGDLALHKNFSEEMKKSQTELDEFLLELDEDVEAMQSTILYLQQQLRESKEQASRLQSEIQRIQTDQVRPMMDSGGVLTNSPKHSPLSATAFEISENFPATPPLTNHIKSNGNVNGPIVANGQEIEPVDSPVNNTARVSATGNKNNCDNLNSRAHSPVHTGRSNSVASSPSSDVNRSGADEECWPDAENNSTREDTSMPTGVSDAALASPSDDKLTIEEQLRAMEECDSLDSAHTPPPTSSPPKEAVTTDDKETPSVIRAGENVDGKGCLDNERVAVNGGVDGISSVSDDDL